MCRLTLGYLFIIIACRKSSRPRAFAPQLCVCSSLSRPIYLFTDKYIKGLLTPLTSEFWRLALLAARYPSVASGEPWFNQTLKASSFSLTASLVAGVHQRVPRFLPEQAPMLLKPQLQIWKGRCASCEKSLWMRKMTSQIKTSNRCSQFTLTTRLGLSNCLNCSLIRFTSRWWSVESFVFLLMWVYRTSSLMTWPQTQSSSNIRCQWPKVLWHQVHL